MVVVRLQSVREVRSGVSVECRKEGCWGLAEVLYGRQEAQATDRPIAPVSGPCTITNDGNVQAASTRRGFVHL